MKYQKLSTAPPILSPVRVVGNPQFKSDDEPVEVTIAKKNTLIINENMTREGKLNILLSQEILENYELRKELNNAHKRIENNYNNSRKSCFEIKICKKIKKELFEKVEVLF